MKKLLIILMALTLGMGAATAQDKKAKKTETVKFVTNLDCENCAKKILNVIPFKKGVKDVVVDVPTKTVEVTFDTRKTNRERLVEELAKIDVLVVEPTCECDEHKEAVAGKIVGEHSKQDACCDGHDHNHSHTHTH